MTKDPRLISGLDLHRAGRLEEAQDLYRQVLNDRPDDPDALHFMGLVDFQQGRFYDARRRIERAVKLAPDRPTFQFNLGNICLAANDLEAAAACFRRAADLEPSRFDALNNLGATLIRLGRADDAVDAYGRAAVLQPDHADCQVALSSALRGAGRVDEALAAAERAIELSPTLASAHLNRGNALQDKGRLDEAEESFRQAATCDPDLAAAPYNLGNLFQDKGRPDLAASSFRQAMAIDPDHAEAHSNLLLALLYDPASDEASLFTEHRTWATRFASGGRQVLHNNTPDPDRPLRIGLISPDFRRHSCAYFIEPLLAALDRRQMVAVAYSDVAQPDDVTRRISELADDWRDIRGLSDDRVETLIRDDRIDILLELSGHTRGNRLRLFARRPAPVQASWLGYAATTGLDAIDWRLTDAVADPPGTADEAHSERLMRLPQGFLCYRPPLDAPEVAPLPAEAKEAVTFGSFNNLNKVTPQVVALWADILDAVPGSRLLLKGRILDFPATRQHYADLFAARGIGSDRLSLHGWIRRQDNPLALYADVDIGLDPFPYNGTTTTCEALWMGVPVITLAGNRHAGRVGASLLNRAGLPELIAEDPAAYLSRAVALAGDRTALARLRADLRERVAASTLCDETGFGTAFGTALRDMWRDWCQRRNAS